jgi:uncharacterized membrane protein
MSRGRLEAFSDGVIAILITIMVLELKVPHGADWAALRPKAPVFITYVLSFIYLAIYWNNHHHMLHATNRINGRILWANTHLLFWLSLVPSATGWMGENHLAPLPTAVYGGILFLAAIAYVILQHTIVSHQGPDSTLAQAVGSDAKGRLSLFLTGGHPHGLRPYGNLCSAVRLRGDDLADPRSADRIAAQSVSGRRGVAIHVLLPSGVHGFELLDDVRVRRSDVVALTGIVAEIEEQVLSAIDQQLPLPDRTAFCWRSGRRSASRADARQLAMRLPGLAGCRCRPVGGRSESAFRSLPGSTRSHPSSQQPVLTSFPGQPLRPSKIRGADSAFPECALAMRERRVAREPLAAVVVGEDDQCVLRQPMTFER